jgi:hypothetical protein
MVKNLVMGESDLNFIFVTQKNFLGLSKFVRSCCAHTFTDNKHYVKCLQSYTLFFLASPLLYCFFFLTCYVVRLLVFVVFYLAFLVVNWCACFVLVKKL